MAQHIFFQGGLGAGKTFAMSLMAHHWRQMVWKNGGDVKLFSNYNLKDSHNMEHFKDWYEVAKAQGSICCWDESQVVFDSRRALKSNAVAATHLMMYTRKMKAVQMYCSPSILNVDSRLRQLVEVLINVRKIGNKGIKLDFYDYQMASNGAFGQYIHTQFIPAFKMKQIFKMNLYDTFQMVRQFPLPNTERQETEFFNELDEIHNQYRVKGDVLNVG